MKYYTGIGSRETPQKVLDLFKRIGQNMALHGITLRSGGADGADTAFYRGHMKHPFSPNVEVYLPWKEFNGLRADPQHVRADGVENVGGLIDMHQFPHYWADAEQIAKEYHPKWNSLGHKSRAYMTRNVFQVLGFDLKRPTDIVFCWTSDGTTKETTKNTGGTGQAIRIAADHNIPILNAKNKDDADRMLLISLEGDLELL